MKQLQRITLDVEWDDELTNPPNEWNWVDLLDLVPGEVQVVSRVDVGSVEDMYPDALVVIAEYLDGAGYRSVDEWAADSGYTQVTQHIADKAGWAVGSWLDEHDYPVHDVRGNLLAAIGYV